MTVHYTRPGRRASNRRPDPTWASAVLVTLVVFVVLGAVAGWLWSAVAQPAEYAAYRGPKGLVPYYSSEAQFGRDFEVDLGYAWIGAIAALVGGIVTGWRHWSLGWAVTVLAGLGAVVGAVLAWWLGHQLGPPPLDDSIAGARVGATFAAPIELSARSITLIWPIAALIGVMVSVWLLAPHDEPIHGAYEVAGDAGEPTV